MKIAIIIGNLIFKGGSHRQALELAVNLQQFGHTVDVYCQGYDKDLTHTDLCNTLKIFSTGKVDPLEKNPIESRKKPGIVRRSATLLKKYAEMIKEIFIPSKYIREFKNLIERHHPIDYYDIINIHCTAAGGVARVINHPHIIWMMNDIHRPPYTKSFGIHHAIYNFLQRILAIKEVKNYSKIIVLDNRNYELCEKIYHRDAKVIRSGVDLEMYSNISNKRDYEKPILNILASNAFLPHRRFEDLVCAIEILIRKRVSNFFVTINGASSQSYPSSWWYYKFIQKIIQDKNLNKQIVITSNLLSEEELKKKYMNSDIFVFPNNEQTWGLSVFEAMLAGCACVVSRGAGAHEVLTNNQNALIVDSCSPEQIAAAIEALIKDRKLLQKISEQGVLFVKENLSWEKYARQMEFVFKN